MNWKQMCAERCYERHGYRLKPIQIQDPQSCMRLAQSEKDSGCMTLMWNTTLCMPLHEQGLIKIDCCPTGDMSWPRLWLVLRVCKAEWDSMSCWKRLLEYRCNAFRTLNSSVMSTAFTLSSAVLQEMCLLHNTLPLSLSSWSSKQ